MAQISVTISEKLRTRDGVSPTKVHSAQITDLAVATASSRRSWTRVATIVDRVAVAQRIKAGFLRTLALRSGVKVSTKTRFGFSAALRSAVTVASTEAVILGTRIAEHLTLRHRQAASARYHRGLSSRVEMLDSLNRPGMLAYLRSVVEVTPVVRGIYRAVAALAHRVDVADTLAPQLTIVVVTHDGVDLTEGFVLHMLYSGQLVDTVDFIIDVADPGGDVTTWAMNVRTGAVTEYLNYSFNAYAKSQSGSYLGAADDGLYELVGHDDAGTPVPAAVMSGLIDFSSSFLSGMKAVYLGMRGEGEFFLKLTGGSGKTMTYGVRTTSLRTKRINVGKGLRERFFTWELVSLGPDYDLIDVTFLPIQNTRRI